MAEKRKDNKGRILRKGESQRKDGRYVYRFTQNKKTVSIYASSLVELREKEKEFANTRKNVSKFDTNTLNYYFDLSVSIKDTLSDSTKSNYVYLYNKFVKNSFGKKKIYDIKHSDLCLFYADLSNNISAGTIKLINNILMPAFELAFNDGAIALNPCKQATKNIKNKSLSEEKRIDLTEYETDTIITYMSASKVYNKYVPMFQVLLGTGARIGEVLALTWNDIDFNNDLININHAINYKSLESDTKFRITKTKTTAGCRVIPMSEDVKNALLSIKKNQLKNGVISPQIDGYNNFIFVNSKGNLYTISNIDRVIKNLVNRLNTTLEKQNNKTVRQFTVHSFRHTFASRLCRKESNLKIIQSVMGHKKIETTMNIYAHSVKEFDNRLII